MARKTFNEKLYDSKDMPKIIAMADVEVAKRYGGHNMLIAPPIAYDELMRRVPQGGLTSTDRIRDYLAKQHGDADFTCPFTAGIFISIAAQASAERDNDKTAYWRTLKRGGELNEKYPGGIDEQRMHLEAEGHRIIQKGKRYFVEDFEKKLIDFN